MFAADLPRKLAAVMAASQRPASLVTLGEPSGAPAWASIPSWALIPTKDNTIGTGNLRTMAKRAKAKIAEVKGASHVVMISQPERDGRRDPAGGQGPLRVRAAVLLVHGAFGETSVWADVIAALRRERDRGDRGRRTRCPASASDATYVASLARALDGPVVLGGHDYGGAVITAASARRTWSGSSTSPAFAPAAGETCVGAAGAAGARGAAAGRRRATAAVELDVRRGPLSRDVLGG